MDHIPGYIIAKFAKKHKLTDQEAQIIFDQLENYLEEASVHRHHPSIAVDQAWHDFIIHTREYMTYCEHKFGAYFHHIPAQDLNDAELDVYHNGLAGSDGKCRMKTQAGCGGACRGIKMAGRSEECR